MTAITGIIVHQTGAGAAQSTFNSCDREDAILTHFRVARPATGREHGDEWYSPCKVSDVLNTADGARDFILQSSGVAALRGEEQDEFVFAEPAWFDPCAGGYQNRDQRDRQGLAPLDMTIT